MAFFRQLCRHNSTTKSRYRIKLGRVVDPIKIHILCENQEFTNLMTVAVAKNCKMTKKSDIDDVINASKMSDNFLNNSKVSRGLYISSFKSIQSVQPTCRI